MKKKNPWIDFLNRYALYVSAVAVLLTYLLYLSPALEAVSRDRATLLDLERKIRERQQELVNRDTYLQQAEELKRRAQELKARLLPLDPEKIMRKIEERAKGVEIQGTTFSEPKLSGEWASLQVTLNGTASYPDLVAFVKQIETSSAWPAVFRSLSITLGEDGQVGFNGVLEVAGAPASHLQASNKVSP